MHYTSSHWGLREVVVDADGTPRLHPFSGDPDPSEIGLDLNADPTLATTTLPSAGALFHVIVS